MKREDLPDLMAFQAVAEERSFTRAAARLGTSQSSLSLIVRRLEERLGVRLLTRTTRSLAPTEAGERLLAALTPAFGSIEEELEALGQYRERPAGSFRITATQHAIDTVLWPKLSPVLATYPDIRVELFSDLALVDIVAQRFDAGVRFGEQMDKDMVAVRIAPDARLVVVGAPSYFHDRTRPQTPRDLTQHDCINTRLPTYGGFYAWEFEKDGQELRVRVDGRLAFNDVGHVLRAALEGHGLAFLFEDMVDEHLAAGRLVSVLDDWTPPFAGYHLYYPSRRHVSPAFGIIIDALRQSGRGR
ncbi:LysR family transcriptional regulator [Ciceribacter sp. L1K23]|uniref:LysR family transcriptional regulator n=1 Tax=Ciceribacter sp. L1K23 TaxID=2820276 RepID=UPI001B831D73|nr:LysR family transcriptional regulator [Ciceribacter sp. L1K23]MBR0556509.1 LysR family transcriptional regulator [Ciceribacter sp. L1K23]